MEAAHDRCTAWWNAPYAAAKPDMPRSGRRIAERTRCSLLLDQVRPEPGIPVSRTHSHGHAAIAVGPAGTRVGIDLEREVDRDFARLSEFAYAPDESSWLRGLPADQMKRSFYCLWTLKEAFAKALGLDLATALAQCRFVPTQDGFVATVPTDAQWSAAAFAPYEGFRMAVVNVAPAGALREVPIEIAGMPGILRRTTRDYARVIRSCFRDRLQSSRETGR